MWMLLAACRGPEPTPDVPADPATHSAAPYTGGRSLVFDGAPPRNLLVLSIDTARKDRFSPWDRESRDLTPFLAERMREGVVLQDMTHCSNWTVASSSCLFWGASLVDRAPDNGMVPILLNNNGLIAEVPDGPGMAHALTDAGYDTMLVTANSWFGEFHGSVRGFSRYFAPGNRPLSVLWNTATGAMEADPLRSPFYLHLHAFEPHDPYLPPASYLPVDLPDAGYALDTSAGQFQAKRAYGTLSAELQDQIVANLRARYEAEFTYYDDQLRVVWADLEARGLLDDTLVVFYSDHGEAQFERSYWGHAFFLPPAENDATAFFWAKNLRPGEVTTPQVAVDLAPTMLDALGVQAPPTMTGHVLGTRRPRAFRTSFTAAFAGPVNAVRSGDYLMQFIWKTESPVRVCNVVTDPDCDVELYDATAPTARDRDLWSLLEPEVLAVAPFLTVDPRVPDGPPLPEELQ